MNGVEQATTAIEFKDWFPAVLGMLGIVIGGFLQVIVHIAIKAYDRKQQSDHEKLQKDILKELLEDNNHAWRKFETLSRVIGADDETTRRLLIEVGARGNQREADSWALIKNQPLRNT